MPPFHQVTASRPERSDGHPPLITQTGGTLVLARRDPPPPPGRPVRRRRRTGPYARIFALPGALPFAVAGIVARLPMGMFGVAAVIMITAHHGSYALAGAVTATGLAASAVVGPLVARLVDRRGQSRIAVPAAALCVCGHLALLLCLRLDAPAWTYFGCALLTATTPNTGGMSRARWAFAFGEDSAEHAAARHAANSFEQAADELCFMLGPVLAALLCTQLFPEAGTLVGAALLLGGMLAFAAQRRTEPPPTFGRGDPHPTLDRGDPHPTLGRGDPHPTLGREGGVERGARPGWLPRRPGMPALLGTFACTGAVFGALEVVTVGFADERGQRAWAGVVLAAQAAGSAAAGLVFGLMTGGRAGHEPTGAGGSARRRFVVCVSAMAVLMTLPLLASRAGDLALLAPALLVAGMATAPTMVTGMTLVQRLVPAGRLNEGMTLMVTALLAGIALGSAGGGWVVDHHGAAPGYALPAMSAALAATLALTTLRRPGVSTAGAITRDRPAGLGSLPARPG
ncbi:MFS transporter [Streptomyces sp. B6B3]|uniref:MFS transporter n=1 Tax=Streptomyces sp. B6B3 TaxID=3153570 RepID=UPI00325CCE4F